MALESIVDQKTGRKCYLDLPSDYSPGEEVIFILSLHGGGSAGAWQREYFPAYDHLDAYRLVIATPSAATKEPMRHWAAEADDDYLVDLAESVVGRLAPANIRAFWLVGHSQGGLTSRRLLSTNQYFADRVDGWLSLSGGRLGLQPRRVENFGPPRTLEDRARMEQAFAQRRIFEPPPPSHRRLFVCVRHRRTRDLLTAPDLLLGRTLRGRRPRPPCGRGRRPAGQDPRRALRREPDAELGSEAGARNGPDLRVPQR